MEFLDLFRYGFLQRALIAGSLIGLVCSTLGVLLVLRRLSLIGDGLAHVAFGTVALGLFLRQQPLYVSIPVVMASSLWILKLIERARLYGDAAIGIVSAIGIAGGVLLASSAGGFNVDLFSYLFGSILAISEAEVITSIFLSCIVLFVILFFYHDLFSTTFDQEFAEVSGINTGRMNSILVLVTAVTVVLTMKVVGIMLTSALLIIPAVTALQLAKSFRGAMVVSALSALLSVVSGIPLSIFLDLPTGATVVMVNVLFFMAALAYKNVLTRGRARAHG